MRILNRPMFKYGGPIKEGVMHGMKNGGRAALVGNPVYPQTGGREHHGKITTIGSKLPVVGGILQKTKGWMPKLFKNIYNKYKFPSAYAPTRTSYHQTRPMMERLGKYVRQHPILTVGGAGVASQSEPVAWAAKNLAQAPVEIAQFATEVLTPKKWEKYLPENEWWKWKSKSDWKPGDIRGEGGDGKDTITTPKETTSRWDDTDPIITSEMRENIAKEKQNERLQSYLDMMGYDSAKRGALDKALIDASALVQDATTEAGSLKKADWGNLINKMIQTTSKRLDKPDQIREAVGLMATKAEIEKDMNKAANERRAEVENLQIKKLKKELKGNSFAQNKVLTGKTHPGQPGFDLAVEITEGTDFKENLINSKQWKKKLEKMQDDPASVGLNEQQLIERYVNQLITGKNYENGHYTVGDNLVEIKDSIVVSVE